MAAVRFTDERAFEVAAAGDKFAYLDAEVPGIADFQTPTDVLRRLGALLRVLHLRWRLFFDRRLQFGVLRLIQAIEDARTARTDVWIPGKRISSKSHGLTAADTNPRGHSLAQTLALEIEIVKTLFALVVLNLPNQH